MNPPDRHSVVASAATFASFDALIDVRSPAEFAEDHVPGALLCPVLDDAERARIGTLYKRESPFQARRLGAALVAQNIARHLEGALAGKPRDWRPLVYCWRGGKRSAAMAHVLREIGWDAKTLAGGYKSYRRWLVSELAALPGTLHFCVVHGATGSGKSRLLRALERAGAQVLDLEALAAHRGSVLGGLPERAQPSQKWFESLLAQKLSKLDAARPVYVEGESRRIGQVQLPEALIEAMRAAQCLMLEAELGTRVAVLMQEYRHFFEDRAALAAQLDCLVGLHGRAVVERWKALAARGAWPELVERLLVEHYDPAYRRSALRNFEQLPRAAVLPVPAADEACYERLARELAGHAASHRPHRLAPVA
jgi:tRNA 2-selenouridine synthase